MYVGNVVVEVQAAEKEIGADVVNGGGVTEGAQGVKRLADALPDGHVRNQRQVAGVLEDPVRPRREVKGQAGRSDGAPAFIPQKRVLWPDLDLREAGLVLREKRIRVVRLESDAAQLIEHD